MIDVTQWGRVEKLTAELAAVRKLLTDLAAAVRLSRANPLPDLSAHPRFAEWQQHAGGLCFTDWLVLHTVAAAEKAQSRESGKERGA